MDGGGVAEEDCPFGDAVLFVDYIGISEMLDAPGGNGS